MAYEVEGEGVGRGNDEGLVRRFERVQIDVGLQVRCSRAAGAGSLRGRASDIGAGGMGAFIPAELEPGQALQLILKLPYSSEQLALQAVVRDRNGFRYGLEFVGLSDRDRAAIERCCMALSLVQ